MAQKLADLLVVYIKYLLGIGFFADRFMYHNIMLFCVQIETQQSYHMMEIFIFWWAWDQLMELLLKVRFTYWEKIATGPTESLYN